MTYVVESYSGPESNPLRLGLVHSILLGSVEKSSSWLPCHDRRYDRGARSLKHSKTNHA
jgi:hypothetical protein